MANIRVVLDHVKVLKGQGIGEGNLEINIKVQEGSNIVHWPAPYPEFSVVDQGGGVKSIGKTVATYAVTSGTLSKKFTISVKEIDKGLLGQDDSGVGWVTFDLTPTMGVVTTPAIINLKRPNMSVLGQVQVMLIAQRS